MSWSECCGGVMAFSAACQRHMMMQYCCGSGSTNKLLCKCFLIRQEHNEAILNVWLYWMTLEGARLLVLQRSVFVASGMSNNEKNQTAVSHFMTEQKQIQVWQLRYLSGIC